jgi:hypothetical protein
MSYEEMWNEDVIEFQESFYTNSLRSMEDYTGDEELTVLAPISAVRLG